jgi:Mg-chelatase subunit ChlD
MAQQTDLKNAHFYCPITEEVMVDPVVDPEGNSYERAAIVEWLRQKGNSPITRTPLRVDQLIPNRSLRNAIEEELALGGIQNARLSAALSESKDQSNDGASGAKDSKDDEPLEPLDPVRLTVTSVDSSSISGGKEVVNVMTSVIPPDCTRRAPADIVCVVDVSGSMGGSANLPGASESSQLSLLDIVKHALKTIINTLKPNDRFALVSYSDVATVVLNLTPLSAAGKSRALSLVSGLQPDGLTNLWDGLLKGMDVLASSQTGGNAEVRNCCVMLLTDGVPNVEPPRGHLPMMRKYKDSHGGRYPGTISTFGFGKMT